MGPVSSQQVCGPERGVRQAGSQPEVCGLWAGEGTRRQECGPGGLLHGPSLPAGPGRRNISRTGDHPGSRDSRGHTGLHQLQLDERQSRPGQEEARASTVAVGRSRRAGLREGTRGAGGSRGGGTREGRTRHERRSGDTRPGESGDSPEVQPHKQRTRETWRHVSPPRQQGQLAQSNPRRWSARTEAHSGSPTHSSVPGHQQERASTRCPRDGPEPTTRREGTGTGGHTGCECKRVTRPDQAPPRTGRGLVGAGGW